MKKNSPVPWLALAPILACCGVTEALAFSIDAEKLLEAPCPAGATRAVKADGFGEVSKKMYSYKEYTCTRDADKVVVRRIRSAETPGEKPILQNMDERAPSSAYAVAAYKDFYSKLPAEQRPKYPSPALAERNGVYVDFRLSTDSKKRTPAPVPELTVNEGPGRSTFIKLDSRSKEVLRKITRTDGERVDERVVHGQGLSVDSSFTNRRPFSMRRTCKDLTSGRTVTFELDEKGQGTSIRVFFGTKRVFDRQFELSIDNDRDSAATLLDNAVSAITFEKHDALGQNLKACATASTDADDGEVRQAMADIHALGKDLAPRAEVRRDSKDVAAQGQQQPAGVGAKAAESGKTAR